MKRALMAMGVVGVLMAGGVGSWRGGQDAPDTGNYAGSDITSYAADELKKAFADEVTAFFQSDDLSKTLGIDSGEQDRLEESVRAYIDHYSMDEQKLSEAKASLEALLQSADGLSAEEIQDRIGQIFGE